jgi:hypothetical protein
MQKPDGIQEDAVHEPDTDFARTAPPAKKSLPDLSEFRASLGPQPYPGNSVEDLREEERS